MKGLNPSGPAPGATLASATALFLILELDTPYGGVIQISNAPVRLVLEHLAK